MKSTFIWSCFLLAFLVASCSTETQRSNESDGNNVKIQEQIDLALETYDAGDYPEFQSILGDAEKLVNSATDTALRISILMNKSELLKVQGKFDECLSNYFSAANLSKLTKDTSRIGLSYYNISATYFMMENLEGARKFNELAQQMYEVTKDTDRLANCQIVNAAINRKLGETERAKQELSEAIAYYEKKGEEGETNLSISLNNFGNVLMNEQKFDEAISYFHRSLAIAKKQNNRRAMAIRFGNIAEGNLELKKYTRAKLYIDSSNVIAEEMGVTETVLENLERLKKYFEALNQPKEALRVMEEYVQLKTDYLELEAKNDLSSIEKRFKQEFEILEANSKITLLEKENAETAHQEASARMKLYFFGALFILLAAVGLILYRKQRRIRAIDQQLHEKEKEVLASRNDLAKAEKDQLEKELEYKRKELRTFSTNIAEKEKFVDELRENIAKIRPNEIPDKKVLKELKQLLLIRSEESMQLYDRIESINQSFHFKLSSNYPELTEDDLRLASLLIIGLSTKEIASLLSIEPKSVSMKRYRLKQKLNLDNQVDLKEFLMKL